MSCWMTIICLIRILCERFRVCFVHVRLESYGKRGHVWYHSWHISIFWFVADRKWCMRQYDMVQMGVPGRCMIWRQWAKQGVLVDGEIDACKRCRRRFPHMTPWWLSHPHVGKQCIQKVVTLRLPTGVNVIVIWVHYLREVGLGSSTQSDRGVTFLSAASSLPWQTQRRSSWRAGCWPHSWSCTGVRWESMMRRTRIAVLHAAERSVSLWPMLEKISLGTRVSAKFAGMF